MKTKITNILTATLGFGLLAAGLLMAKQISNPQGIMKSLPYVCIGIGCGLFGQGFGNIISSRVLKSDPMFQKRIEIEKKDERNVAITNRAKAKAYDIMVFVFGALMLSFALMNVSMVAVLLLVFAYLFVIGSSIYYRSIFEKEM
jgi:hypothetical protein